MRNIFNAFKLTAKQRSDYKKLAESAGDQQHMASAMLDLLDENESLRDTLITLNEDYNSALETLYEEHMAE